MKTIAQKYRSEINKEKNIDAKIYIASIARKEAKYDSGNVVSRLVFSDNSKLEINTKFKAKLINA